MLNAAMVLMILAGVFGIPAAWCSAGCAEVARMGSQLSSGPNDAAAVSFFETLKWLVIIAALGSIIVGAIVKRVGKKIAGVSALLFACIFATQMFYFTPIAILPTLMLLIAAVMIFVAPAEQFRNVVRVESVR